MNDFFVSLMLLGAMSGDYVSSPFWMTANRYGLMPQGSGALALLQAGNKYDESKTVQWQWGVSAGASTDAVNGLRFLPDEAYAAIKWKFLSLEAGMKRREQRFLAAGGALGSISTTAGNVVWSGNAPTMPGYSLNVHPVDIPGTGGHLSLMGRFGDYWTIDRRYMQGAMVHNTAFGMRVGLNRRNTLRLLLGLDHYALWGGKDPVSGVNTGTFRNYLSILVGSSASADSGYGIGDQINVAGNHLGRILIGLDYKGKDWKVVLQWDRPYEDKSGMLRFQNVPDGVYTASFSFDDRTRWVTDILYECQYTLWQGGTSERRPATKAEIDASDPRLFKEPDGTWSLINGGADNYFNNFGYVSGWTHSCLPLGNPLFYPCGTLQRSFNRVAAGSGVENNRVFAHHIGLSGMLFKVVPYKLLLTYSENYGTYFSDSYTGVKALCMDWKTLSQRPLRQFSGGFQCEIPCLKGALDIVPGIFWDCGDVLARNVGATVGLRYVFKMTE